MNEIFHKPAKKDWQDQLRRGGVLNAESLADCSELRAFAPSPGLATRISHYWVLRWTLPPGRVWRPVEVLSAPVVNLFFLASGSFVQGITPTTLEYEARDGDVIAGVTFLPGGFSPYWKGGMHTLPGGRTPVEAVFPTLTEGFCRSLLAGDDPAVARGIDRVFLDIDATDGLHQRTILDIVSRVDSDPGVRTVAAVSRVFQIPERTLQHIFRTEVGTSLKWVTMRARLLEAVARSLGTDRPDWSAVALEHGYSSQAHFIKDFQWVFGVSPERYRRLQPLGS